MKILILIIITAIILGSFILIEDIRADDTKIVFVDNNYDSNMFGWMVNNFSNISDAINATETGDTVFVYNGTYFEHIILDKSIVLMGEDRNNTIIDGKGVGNTVSVIADDVSISEFTIRNSGVKSNNSGIMVLSDGNIIYDAIVINNSVGIILQGCRNNAVKDNIIKSNVFGIGLHHCTKKNSIFNNHVSDNNVTGIYLTFSSNSTVYNNSVKNNGYGIAISYSEDNDIFDNVVDGNIHDGFNLFFCNKTVFIRNTISGSEYGITSTASNNNMVGENYIYNCNLRGITLVLGSCDNEVYDNIITDGDVGVYISIDSFDTLLKENLFCNNDQKIIDEAIKNSKNHTPGFELIIIITSIFFILYSKKNY